MKRKIIVTIVLVLFCASMLNMALDIALLEAEEGWEPVIPRIEKTGTYFEINNSEYLNVSITSSEVVYILLFAPPTMIDYSIESASEANSTTLTLNNLQPNTHYYIYEDGYINEDDFYTDNGGSYTYTQDISQRHKIFIQENQGTVFIYADTTLTSDIYDTVEICASGVTLDLNGYTIFGGDWIGIDVIGKNNVVIKNGYVKNCGLVGIYLTNCHDVTIENVTASNNWWAGVYLEISPDNFIINNTLSNNDYGIEMIGASQYNTVVNNTIQQNSIGLKFNIDCYWNVVYHNNFIDNQGTPQALSSTVNTWDDDYPSGGNYWSDYNGVDVKKGANQDLPGSDGIGDASYVINGNNMDNYPLIYPYGAPILPSHTLTILGLPNDVTFTVSSIPVTTPWSETYHEGASVSLVMPETYTIGEARYNWDQWSDTESSRSRTVIMNSEITLTAYYTGPYYQLTVMSSPITGIPLTINGAPETTPYSEWLLEGSYNLEMPETHNGYVWSHWLEDGDPNRIKTISLPGTTWTAVFAVETATGSGTVLFETDVGTIEDLVAIDEATLPTEGKPDLEFPHGFFSFNVTGLIPGQAVTITITYPSNMEEGTQYWKCQNGVWERIPVGDDDGDNVITITVTDGWIGDGDKIENGKVNDPGGAGIPLPIPPTIVGGTTISIKSEYLSSWIATTLLMLFLVVASSICLKHKKHLKA